MTSTAILVPVLGRPHRVVPTMESVARFASDYRLLFIASEDDHDELAALKDAGAEYICVGRAVDFGQYAKKVNAAYGCTDEPFLFLGADDLRFHPRWLGEALKIMADPAAAVVGTQDLCNVRTIAGTHSTHSLVRRSYVDEHGTIDEPGKVLHEGYWHEFVDDELVATAKHRGVWSFAAESVVEHLHPQVGKAEPDDLYRMQRHRMAQGRRLFNLRKWMWEAA